MPQKETHTIQVLRSIDLEVDLTCYCKDYVLEERQIGAYAFLPRIVNRPASNRRVWHSQQRKGLLFAMRLPILCTTYAVLISTTRAKAFFGDTNPFSLSIHALSPSHTRLKLRYARPFEQQVDESFERGVSKKLFQRKGAEIEQKLTVTRQDVEKGGGRNGKGDGSRSFPIEALKRFLGTMRQAAGAITLAQDLVTFGANEEEVGDSGQGRFEQSAEDDGRGSGTGISVGRISIPTERAPDVQQRTKKFQEIAKEIFVNGSNLTPEQAEEISQDLAKDPEFGKIANQLKDIPISELETDLGAVLGKATAALREKSSSNEDRNDSASGAIVPVSIIAVLGVTACIAGIAFILIAKRKRDKEKMKDPFSRKYRPKENNGSNIIMQNLRWLVNDSIVKSSKQNPKQKPIDLIECKAEERPPAGSRDNQSYSLDQISLSGMSTGSETPWTQSARPRIADEPSSSIIPPPRVGVGNPSHPSAITREYSSSYDDSRHSVEILFSEGYTTITRDSSSSHDPSVTTRSGPFYPDTSNETSAATDKPFDLRLDQEQSNCSQMMTRTLLSMNQTSLSIGPQSAKTEKHTPFGLHLAICLDTSSAFSEGEFSVIKRLLCNGADGLVDRLAEALEGETLCTLATYSLTSPAAHTISYNSTTDLCSMVSNQPLSESGKAREVHLGLNRCFSSLRSSRNDRSAELRRVVVLSGGPVTENGRSGVGFAAWEAARALHRDGVPVVAIDFNLDTNNPGPRIASGDPPLCFPVEGVTDFSKVIEPLALLLGNPHLTPEIETSSK